MWLAVNNRILIKDNLLARGWSGINKCRFCNELEFVDHLFLHCTLARHVWFWLGNCQDHFCDWNSCKDVMIFALQLAPRQRVGFLLVFSAMCWTIWKHRNKICFQLYNIKSNKSLILLIVSLVEYWTGNTKQQVKEAVVEWMPAALDIIPLRTWDLSDSQMVLVHGEGSAGAE